MVGIKGDLLRGRGRLTAEGARNWHPCLSWEDRSVAATGIFV
jgi:hypothetical protein